MTLCSRQRVPVLRGEFQLDRLSTVRRGSVHDISGEKVRRSAAYDASEEKQQIAGTPGKIYALESSSKVKVNSL
jgi:hypothetical protein